MSLCRRPNDTASVFASSSCPCDCPRVNLHGIGSGTILTFTLAVFRLMTMCQPSTFFVIVRRRSCVADFFSPRRSATRARIFTWPGRSIAFGNAFGFRALGHACRPLSTPAALMGLPPFAVLILFAGALAARIGSFRFSRRQFVFPRGGPTCCWRDTVLDLFLSRDWPLKLLHPHST